MKRMLQWTVAIILLGSLTLDYERGFQFSAAYAQASGTLTINWTPPTQYEDGFPLLEQELDFYTFSCGGVEVKQIDNVVGTRTDAVDVSGLPSGSYTCHLTVTTLEAMESGPSNTINFTIGSRVPMAPGLASS
jgi:hypothetical protein